MPLCQPIPDGLSDLLCQRFRLGDEFAGEFADPDVICGVALLLDSLDLKHGTGGKPDGVPKRLDHVVVVVLVLFEARYPDARRAARAAVRMPP